MAPGVFQKGHSGDPILATRQKGSPKAMTRTDLLSRQRNILARLEAGWRNRSGRDLGPWVTGTEIQDQAGRRFSVGINEMAPKKPTEKKPGLGFKIRRKPLDTRRMEWKYLLVKYPIRWLDNRVRELIPRRRRPDPKQRSLFAA